MIYLGDIPMLNARRFADTEAVVCGAIRLNWRQFNDRINRLANGLKNMGYRKGAHIAVLLDNCHQYLEIYYALAKNGMVTVPLNYRLADRELAHVIDHSDAVGLIVGSQHYDKIVRLRQHLKNVQNYIGVEVSLANGLLDYEQIVAASDPGEPDWEILDENDMVILMYTGGTTGLPKGVMLSHRNMISAFLGIAISQRTMLVPGLRTLFALPFFHIANWQAFFFHMLAGCVVISRTTNPAKVVDLIKKEKTVVVNLVPTVYQNMIELPDLNKKDFRHVASFSVGGAPIAPATLKKCTELFGLKMGKGYGLTEAASAVASLSASEFATEGDPELVRRSKSVGRETINARVKIRRLDGTECQTGEEGEITVFGKNIMLGYWKDPQLTARTLQKGWLWTGDIAYKDEDGYIFLVDRKNDMIITGGENVYPTEVENILYQHPAVMEATVFGIPDEKWGEAVKAVVAVKPDQSVDAEELIAFCKKHISGYKSPKSIDILPVLPKTDVGKINRKALKSQYETCKKDRI